jgi:predicted RNA binding protein YcfA (HicA-like mRNA interferase family)
LEKQGFVVDRQKGSHRFYKHNDGRATTVPIHTNKDISRGLLGAILDEIGMERNEFFKLRK